MRRWWLLKRSLDARGRREPRFTCTVVLELREGTPALTDPSVTPWRGAACTVRRPPALPSARPLVVGSGPAGLFAALRLCEYGLKPLVLERGRPVDERVRDVSRYWKTGALDAESNVQFGEGGAGTFSDGKLTYRGKDPRKDWVIARFVEFGASSEILWEAKPHLGTDRLRGILRRVREGLQGHGAEFAFGRRVESLLLEGERVVGVETAEGLVRGRPVFLAPGHSARDLYARLDAQGLGLEAKGFAIGVRVEAPQELLEFCQYGRWAGGEGLPRAEFTVKARAGRDVYSFCMCPGGVVIPAGSEANGLVVNGMSASGRTGRWGNAALVVPVDPADFGGQALAGVAFQREVEQRAWSAGGGTGVPVQKVRDFLAGKSSADLPRSSCPWALVSASLDTVLPEFVARALREALPALIRQLPPLAEGLLLGVETRTSSPVRIPRSAGMESVTWRGLYPIGEGAGYAGGIVSAAVDGARAADAYGALLGGGVEEKADQGFGA